MKQKQRKIGRKLLSFLLTLAMVVGLFPGMSFTAFAASTTVTWNASDIVTVNPWDKSFTKDGITFAPGHADFLDKNFTNGGTFTTASGKFTKIEVTAPYVDISGTGWSGGSWTGDASSSVSYSGDIYDVGMGQLKIVFTIAPAKQAQTITASDVTATYGDTGVKINASTNGDGALSYAVKSGDAVTVDASGNLTINKAGSAVITVTAAETDTYAKATKDVSVTISTKAMTVSAEDVNATVDGQPHGITVTVTDPASSATVKYGTEAGSYTLDASPAQTEVGEKTVYYQVTADNYTTYTGSAKVTVSAKQTQTITAENVSVNYGDTDKKVSATTDGNGAISYAVKDGSAAYIDVNASTGALAIKAVPADGKAYVIVTAAETSTYAQATKEVTVTINKANAVSATVTPNNRTYDGTEQPLVTVTGTPTGGTMYYALGTNATTAPADNLYTTSIPAKTDAGTYYVWYKVIGDKNHLDTKAEPIEVKIDKAKGAFPKPANISLWSSDMACVDAVDGQEYVIVEKGSEPDWTKAVTGDEDGTVIFEGLQPYTEYDIYTRVKETENVYAGEAVSTAFLTDLAGFSVEGDTYVGETLTITPDPEDAEGLSYKWYYVNIVEEDEGYRRTELGDAIEGAEGATYTLTEDDYGKYVCVVISRGDKEYDRSSEYGPVEYDPEKISYRNTEGAGGEWTKGSSDSLQMTFKRSVVDSETIDHFKGILVDGKAVDASDYTDEAGSVIIKLNPSYLETLTVGEHVLAAQFDDGEDAEATFTIANADKTDDEVDEPEEEKADDAKVDEPEEEKADDTKVDEPEEEKADDAKIEEPEPEKPVQEAPADNTPKTSDNMNVPGVLFVMDLALLGMIVVMLLIGREKKRRRR